MVKNSPVPIIGDLIPAGKPSPFAMDIFLPSDIIAPDDRRRSANAIKPCTDNFLLSGFCVSLFIGSTGSDSDDFLLESLIDSSVIVGVNFCFSSMKINFVSSGDLSSGSDMQI